MPKRRKDQDIVDLAERIKRDLGDDRPKSFGLYMKLIKEFGRKNVEKVFWRAVRSGADDKMRYFLGILSHMRETGKALRAYRSLRAPILAKMTPKPQWYEKPPRNRSRRPRKNPSR